MCIFRFVFFVRRFGAMEGELLYSFFLSFYMWSLFFSLLGFFCFYVGWDIVYYFLWESNVDEEFGVRN